MKKYVCRMVCSFYINNSKLRAIIPIPRMVPIIVTLLFSYSRAIGRSSSIEINTIIPAIAPNKIPNSVSLKNGRSIRYPIIAPKGSVIPEKKETIKAFFLLPLE